jgi:shikimate dehydrogenase
MTERVGLFGWPVEHSVSPPMHNAAFAALGLDWRYELFSVPPDRFEAEVARLMVAGCRGFNVTIPHKQAAFRLPQVTVISPAAEAIGAVNTLVVRPGGTLQADNTDWRGFADDLAGYGVTISGARCLVLGTGGSARGVGYALAHGGAAWVTQVSRRPDGRPAVVGYSALPELAPAVDLVINCTPVGMAPKVAGSPWPDEVPFPARAVLYDLVYNPPVTRLMQQAERAGASAYNGLGMLVRQGALAFVQWTGQVPPLDVMTQAAAAALYGE